MARVVVVEAWYRGSHRAWADGLATRSAHDVELVTLPGVHWRWRLHGGALALSRAVAASCDRHGAIDVLVASGAVDLAALLGLARHALHGVPALLYLHENQLTFPRRPDEDEDVHDALATWRSMAAADRVVCNSAFHRDELFAALPPMLARFPDHRAAAAVEEVRARTSVVGVGVDVDALAAARSAAARAAATRPAGSPTRILWNHRWEHDKDPVRFVDALVRLAATGRAFEVVVAGSHLPRDRVVADLAPVADRIAHVGSVPREAYPALVASCDLAVSTARHEFYGVALAEAAAAGVVPVAPRALAYPELVPDALHDELLYDDDASLDALLARGVDDADRRDRLAAALAEASSTWSADACAAALDAEIEALLDAHRPAG